MKSMREKGGSDVRNKVSNHSDGNDKSLTKRDETCGINTFMLSFMELSTKNLLRMRFVDIKVKANGGRKSYMASPQGAWTYFIGGSFLEQARKLEIASDITLNLEGLRLIDHDALCLTGKVLTEWAKTITDAKVWIKDVNPAVYPSLEKHAWFSKAEDKGEY